MAALNGWGMAAGSDAARDTAGSTSVRGCARNQVRQRSRKDMGAAPVSSEVGNIRLRTRARYVWRN